MQTIHVTASNDQLCIRAELLVDAGRFDVARPILAAVQASASPCDKLTLMEARLAVADGDLEAAIRLLNDAIGITPRNEELRKFRADVLRRMGDFECAARDAAEALAFRPVDPQAKAILGAALIGLNQIDSAIKCFQEAVRAEPKDIRYREALAAALEKAGRDDDAFSVLIDGIALCPANVSMRNAVILLSVRRRDFNGALEHVERARSLGLADACTFGMKGHALSSLGQQDEASVAYHDALKLAPEDPYVRHLVAAAGLLPNAKRTPKGYIRTVFDAYADRFETHLISLSYRIPVAIRSMLKTHPKVADGRSIGPVLDLGCGTGLVALTMSDLPLGPFTGVDLSPRMLAQASAKQLYIELREEDIVDHLDIHKQRWPLIVAADVLCYFGDLEDLLQQIYQGLETNGWFIFSTETLLADHQGVVPGNGSWALQRQGRYAHSEDYVCNAARAAQFQIVRLERLVLRQEAESDVQGLLLVIERI